MYSLVQFIGDGMYYVCKTNNVKRNSQYCTAKWLDTKMYECIFIASSENMDLLVSFCKNIMQNYPVVLLEKCKAASECAAHLSDNLLIKDTVSDVPGEPKPIVSEDETVFVDDVAAEDVAPPNDERLTKKYALVENVQSGLNSTSTEDETLTLSIEGKYVANISNYIMCEYCFCLIGENEAVLHLCKEKLLSTSVNSRLAKISEWESDICKSSSTIDNRTESTFATSDNTNTNLCMYCGCFCENLLEHIESYHDKDTSGIRVESISESNSAKANYPNKQHYCLYCNTLQYKLARHLERKHSSEEDIKEAVAFHKGSRERRLLFAEIQKKGDFLYSTHNISSDRVIPMRRSFHGDGILDTVICPYCKGFYSKKNLRNHVKSSCLSKTEGNERSFKEMGLKNLMVRGRSIFPKIHKAACDGLRNRIFPVMKNDEITNALAYDELAIKYGNFLVAKYASSRHHDNMIRSKLRHLSRILLEMKKMNSQITEVKSIFDSSNFDTFIEAVYNIAGLQNGTYKNPSLGPSSVTLILHVGSVLETEAVKLKDYGLEKETKRFCKLVSVRSNSLINKVAIENRTQSQRAKIVRLPKTEDINQLLQNLESEIRSYMKNLQEHFDLATWSRLNKIVLIKIMVFNRKRPGDVEKSQIIEYDNLQMIDQEHVSHLESSQKECGQLYGRYITRGKLNRPAAILLSKTEMQ